jgi:hypothetical protein
MRNWARFAGFAALLSVALGGSLLWALDYTPQNTEWTCKSQADPNHPENRAFDMLVCHPAKTRNLQPHSDAANSYRGENSSDNVKITDKLLAIFTGFLVLVGAVQGYYLWNASDATRQSVEVAERALTELEAPFIGLKVTEAGVAAIWRGEELEIRQT